MFATSSLLFISSLSIVFVFCRFVAIIVLVWKTLTNITTILISPLFIILLTNLRNSSTIKTHTHTQIVAYNRTILTYNQPILAYNRTIIVIESADYSADSY